MKLLKILVLIVSMVIFEKIHTFNNPTQKISLSTDIFHKAVEFENNRKYNYALSQIDNVMKAYHFVIILSSSVILSKYIFDLVSFFKEKIDLNNDLKNHCKTVLDENIGLSEIGIKTNLNDDTIEHIRSFLEDSKSHTKYKINNHLKKIINKNATNNYLSENVFDMKKKFKTLISSILAYNSYKNLQKNTNQKTFELEMTYTDLIFTYVKIILGLLVIFA